MHDNCKHCEFQYKFWLQMWNSLSKEKQQEMREEMSKQAKKIGEDMIDLALEHLKKK